MAYREERGGRVKADKNRITVRLGDMAITGVYTTILKSGRNSASNIVVGGTVQARLDGRRRQKLVVLIPGGGEVRADVVRREAVSAE